MVHLKLAFVNIVVICNSLFYVHVLYVIQLLYIVFLSSSVLFAALVANKGVRFTVANKSSFYLGSNNCQFLWINFCKNHTR